MCGIAGILSCDGSPVARRTLEAMTDALRHRGPDGGAVVLLDAGGVPAAGAAPLGLGHRRLKVVDLSEAAAQPMTDAGRSGWITYNGEIYNTGDLRAALGPAAAGLRSRSDTEVALLSLLAWGRGALRRFNGMFALAFYDARRRRLLLARDRFGEKPLYYAEAGGQLVFASEIGAALRHGGVDAAIDEEALELYLTFGFIPAPWTIYRGVRKLPHGGWLEAGPGRRPEVGRWFDLDDLRHGTPPADPETAVREALIEAVRRRAGADVPLGAFLSGGVDSAAVVAAARGHLRGPRTFSVAIGGPRWFDESAQAEATARALGTRHLCVRADGPRLQEEIAPALEAFGEPFADASALASSIVAAAARREVTVALSGDGGDEVFGGYRLYRALAAHGALRRIPAGLRAALGAGVALLPARHGAGPAEMARALAKLLPGLAVDLAGAHAAWMSVTDAATRRALRPGRRDVGLGRALVEERHLRFGGGPGAILPVEIDLPLPDDMLVKVDRTSMRHGLEVRAPFLDPDLVALALSLPPAAHFTVFATKRLLRRALRPILPRHVLRRPKRGFEVPVGHWIAGPLQPLFAALASRQALEAAGVEAAAAAGLLRAHARREADHGRILWALLALGFWLRGPRRLHEEEAAAGRQERDGSRSEAIVSSRSEGRTGFGM